MKKTVIVLVSTIIGFLLGTVITVLGDTPTDRSLYCQLDADRQVVSQIYLGMSMLETDTEEFDSSNAEMAQFIYDLSQRVLFATYDQRYEIDSEGILNLGDSLNWAQEC